MSPMKGFVLLLLILAMLVAGLTSQLACAQGAPTNPTQQNQIEALEKPVAEIRQEIRGWELSAEIQVVLIVSVITFGALISAFHGSKGRWGRGMVLALGIATSIVTGINAKLFPADYRALFRASRDAEVIAVRLGEMIGIFRQAPLHPDELQTFKVDFAKKFDAFEQIARRIDGADESGTTSINRYSPKLFSLPTVEAQTSGSGPEWIRKLPADGKNLYFVGRSTVRSLSQAQNDSHNDAVNQVFQAIGQGEPYTTSQAQRALILDSLTTPDFYFTYDSGSSTYTYYTLARISRDLLPSPMTYQQSGWDPIGITYDTATGLLVLDADGGVSRVRVDQKGIHLQTLFQVVGQGRYFAITSNKESVFVSEMGRTDCIIYRYSLADLKATKTSIPLQRGICDGIAANGKALYLAIPGQHEFRYWADWSSSSPQSWSFPEVATMGVLSFDAIGQRLIYADTSGDTYALSVPSGKLSRLTSNVGYVHAVATDSRHVIFASGEKLLFYSRYDNRGENPPPSMRFLPAGEIQGVAIDGSDAVWVVDTDHMLIKGPLLLN